MINFETITHICKTSDPNVCFTAEPESMVVDSPPEEPDTEDLYTDLSVNSVVEVTLGDRNSYGIIRWIGTPMGRQEIMAGLELVIFIPRPFALKCFVGRYIVTEISAINNIILILAPNSI